QDNLADGDGIFAGLDVDVGDTGRTMMDEHLGELIVPRAKAVQVAVVTAHPAVMAVFPAKIGDLDDGADKNILAEFLSGSSDGELMKCLLLCVLRTQVGLRW